jgi:prepilin-type N-terminal cleavage/methylation domain-containing protein
MTGARQQSSECDQKNGFTLVELLLAVSIMGLIMAPLSLGFITGLRFIGRTDERFTDSRSALIAAAYFAGDVSTANTIVRNDAAACGGGTALVSFNSSDANGGVGAAQNNEVSYVYDTSIATNKRLLRKYCANAGAAVQAVTAVSLGSAPTVTCYDAANVVNATCVNARRVRLVVTQMANKPSPDVPAPAPYTFTLDGTRRPA